MLSQFNNAREVDDILDFAMANKIVINDSDLQEKALDYEFDRKAITQHRRTLLKVADECDALVDELKQCTDRG